MTVKSVPVLIQAAAKLSEAADAVSDTLALRARAPRQVHITELNAIGRNRMNRKGGGEIGRRGNPLAPFRFFSPPRCFLRFFYGSFGTFSIVSGDASPISTPSSQMLNLLATISRISRSSVVSILPRTSFPSISLSMKRYKPLE